MNIIVLGVVPQHLDLRHATAALLPHPQGHRRRRRTHLHGVAPLLGARDRSRRTRRSPSSSTSRGLASSVPPGIRRTACGVAATTRRRSRSRTSSRAVASRAADVADNVGGRWTAVRRTSVEEARILLAGPQGDLRGCGPRHARRHAAPRRTLRDAGELREAEQVLDDVAVDAASSRPRTTTATGCVGPSSTWPSSSTGSASTTRHDDSGSASWRPPTGRADPTAELSVRTATNLAITLRKLHRYGDEFPLRVRVLEATQAHVGARSRRDVHGADRAGPDAAQPRQPRDGAEPLHRGPRRPRAQRQPTSGRSSRRSGPSPRSSWRSSDRRRPPPCSTRS